MTNTDSLLNRDVIMQNVLNLLQQDQEGQSLLTRLATDPHGTKKDFANWLHIHSAQMPAPLATYVSDSAHIDKLVNIAHAGIVILQNTPSPDISFLWNVPFPRNPFFTGRDTILQQIHNTFQKHPELPQALSGMGGIGKTEIALEYTHRYRGEYSQIFWVKADSQVYLKAEIIVLAHLLKLIEHEEPPPNVTVAKVLSWLNTHSGWLLIIDNAYDLKEIANQFLPTAGKGHILLTTLSSQITGRIAKRIPIEKMTLEEGIHFLLRSTTSIDPSTLNEKPSEKDQALAREFVELVDGHPLALHQAKVYIEENGSNLSKYLTLYQTKQKEVLQNQGWISQKHSDSEATTVSLSLREVYQANLAAFYLLKLLAFLHPDKIPEEIITNSTSNLGPQLNSIMRDQLKYDRAIGELLKYSLISHNGEAKTFTIHRLIQVILKNEMDEGTQRRWALRAVQVVSNIYQNSGFQQWQRYPLYLPQAYTCADLIRQWEIISTDAVLLLTKVSSYLQDTLRLADSESFLKQTVEILYEQAPGNPLDVATSLNNLGTLYMEQGHYEDAEPLLERVLAIRKAVLGKDHPNTANSLNTLAILYERQGRYEDAEPLLDHALAICKAVLGKDHPNTATCLNTLAILYERQGRYEDAELLLDHALAIRKVVLGEDHPDTASSLNNLATLYRDQGRYEKAEHLLKKEDSLS